MSTQLQPVAIHETMESGLEVVRFGTMGPGEHPVGSMDAMDQPDPLALTEREQAIVDSWENEGKATTAVDPDSPESRLSADDPDVEALEGLYEMEARDSGFVAPSKEKGEDESKKAPGFFTSMADRIGSIVKKHPTLSKAVAGLGIVGAASGVFAETAKGYQWSHLGGDPLFAGGAKNEKEFIRNITSSKGKRALQLLGFNKRERGALIQAARRGEAESCTTRVGEHFDKMTYGLNGPSVVNNVTFADPRYRGKGAPAWCLEAELPRKGGGTEIIAIETPKKCSNFALKGRKTTTPPETPHKPPTGKLVLTKAFEDANGNPLSISGQEFLASCKVPGKKERVTNRFEYNPAQRRGPVTAIEGCKVGSVATMMEITTPEDLAHWNVLTGTPVVKDGQTVGYSMKQKVDRGRNLFGFKNQQKRPNTPPTSTPPQTPPQEVFLPPSVTIDSWDHIKTGDIQQICSYPSDGDNDIVSTVFTENGNGSFTTNALYPNASPSNPYDPNPGNGIDEDCILYAAGSLGQENATITMTVTDARDQKAYAVEGFDIAGSEDPRGEF